MINAEKLSILLNIFLKQLYSLGMTDDDIIKLLSGLVEEYKKSKETKE